MDAEHIILSKRYIELSADELAEISSYVSNESEFDDMKAFLLSTQLVVNTQKIKSTPELDKKVMNYLNQSYPQAQPWYNSVLLFLFPRDKQFFKYPAFQIVVASLLVFGAFNLVDFKSMNQSELAYEDTSKLKTEDFIEKINQVSNKDKIETISINEEIISQLEDIETESEDEYLDVSEGTVEGKNKFYDVAVSLDKENFSIPIPTPIANELIEVSGKPGMTMNDNDMGIVETDDLFEVEEVNTQVSNGVPQPTITTTNQSTNIEFKDSDSKSEEVRSGKNKKSLSSQMEKIQTTQKEEVYNELVNKVSIQSTPELLNLFFEVK